MINGNNVPRNYEGQRANSDPMTDAQRVSLDTLSGQAGEPTPDDNLSEAEASQKIDQLHDTASVENEDVNNITTETDPDSEDPSSR